MIYFSNGETENQMPARRAAPAGMRQPRAPRADGDLTRSSTPRSAAKMLPLHTLATLGARAGSLLPLGRAGVSRPRAAGVAAVGARATLSSEARLCSLSSSARRFLPPPAAHAETLARAPVCASVNCMVAAGRNGEPEHPPIRRNRLIEFFAGMAFTRSLQQAAGGFSARGFTGYLQLAEWIFARDFTPVYNRLREA